VSDFAYRMIMENGRMTTNEIWAAAQESETRISHSENTNQISNRLRVSPLFIQHGTVRQRSARGAIGVNVGGNSGAQGMFYQDGMWDGSQGDAVHRPQSVRTDAIFYNTPLWDIADLDEVAKKYIAKTHRLKLHRLPAILRNRIKELMSDE